MFKLLLLAFIPTLTVQVFANSKIELGGPTSESKISIDQSIYRQVESYEPYQSTCYREVYVGTRSECTPVYETRCTKVPYECHQEETAQSCTQEPEYRTESYSCIEYRRVINDVYDHSVHANISVVKNENSKQYDLNNCQLNVSVNDGDENYYATCKTSIIRAKIISREEKTIRNDKERNVQVELDFKNIEGLKALSENLHSLHFANGNLTFEAANLIETTNYKLHLKLVRNKFLRKDPTVLDQDLKVGQFSASPLENGRFLITINMKNIYSDFNSKKKHTASVSIKTINQVDVTGSINQPVLVNELADSLIINE